MSGADYDLERSDGVTQREDDPWRSVAREKICRQNDIDRHHHQFEDIVSFSRR